MGRAGDGRDRRAVDDPLAEWRFLGAGALRLVALGTALSFAGAAHAVINARLLRRPVASRSGRAGSASVSVLIPARDEALTIAGCVSGVGRGHEVIVCDDGSRDGTAAVARAAGARVIVAAPLPAGWLGKPHACSQLAAQASGDVLVFLDADVRLEPGAVDAAAAMLDAHALDLVAPHPRQIAITLAERLAQPLLQWSVLTMLPLRVAEQSSRPSLCAANGQFLVVRRSVYERAGGHSPDAVLDDIALARKVKRIGGRVAFVDGTDLAGTRMYESWPELRDGYGKSLWSAFGSPAGSAAAFAGLAVAYLLPPLAALRGSRIGLAGYAAAVAGRIVTARRTGGRSLDAAAHPASIVVFGYLLARSHLEHRRGRLRWKRRPIP